MPTPIRMPDFGTAVTEVKIAKWLVDEGQAVIRGTLLAEIETDKAATELECVAEGVLLKQCAMAGAAVEAGRIIAYVGAPGEALPEDKPAAPRVAAVAANLAAKLGVDLAQVTGTGEQAMITREDVLRASQAPAKPAAPVAALSRTQAAVARAVLKSTQEIPHLRIVASIDMSAVKRLRPRRVSYDAIFLRAMALAAQAVPLPAAQPDGIHISLAVGFGNELALPVVRDANRKDLPTLQAELDALIERAVGGALRVEDLTGGCMTLSNLGMYPIDSFDAIIFPGQSAILALGAAQDRVIAIEHHIEIRPMATVTLSADHRLINGRVAAGYVAKLKEILESGAFA